MCLTRWPGRGILDQGKLLWTSDDKDKIKKMTLTWPVDLYIFRGVLNQTSCVMFQLTLSYYLLVNLPNEFNGRLSLIQISVLNVLHMDTFVVDWIEGRCMEGVKMLQSWTILNLI